MKPEDLDPSALYDAWVRFYVKLPGYEPVYYVHEEERLIGGLSREDIVKMFRDPNTTGMVIYPRGSGISLFDTKRDVDPLKP